MRVGYRTVIGALVVAVLLVVFSLIYVLFGWPKYLTVNSNTPAWVQAFGAMVSIWAAWVIARQQSKRAEVNARRADLAKCAAVVGVIGHSLRAVDLQPGPREGAINVAELIDRIDKSISSLERIDVLMLPDPDLVAAIFETMYSLQRLRIKVIAQDRKFLVHNHYCFSIAANCMATLEEQIKICEEVAARKM